MRSIFIRCLLFCILLSVIGINSVFAEEIKMTFSGVEHLTIGKRVVLVFDREEPGQRNPILHLPNGLNISYGDILTFGDFYGVLGKPISTAESEHEAKMRFVAAFHSFAREADAVLEGTKLLGVIHDQEKILQEGMERGEEPEKILKRISNEAGRQYNCITGGGCNPNSWWLEPGRYLLLANEDFDHFNLNAWRAYQIGHQVAIELALKANRTRKIKDLELAYAANAFASHFLSDLFATGHLRTPRLELSNHVSPALTGSLLSGYMHAEENSHGLHVHNLRGDRWTAYGDHYFFSNKNKINRELLEEAMQLSASEIFFAYNYGEKPTKDMEKIIPYADEIGNASNVDISPLFYWDDSKKKLMRRKDLNNLYDRHWTTNWWGWSTLAMLRASRGLPSDGQALLARSELKSQAIKDGLISDPYILEYVRR